MGLGKRGRLRVDQPTIVRAGVRGGPEFFLSQRPFRRRKKWSCFGYRKLVAIACRPFFKAAVLMQFSVINGSR
jgi:hypothetical protein